MENKNLYELYDLFVNDGNIVYKNSDVCLDILFFDLSVKRAFFYAYQEMSDLIIFGKFFEQNELISVRIKKREYIENLKRLLSIVDI